MTLDEVESIFGQPPGEYDWAVAEDPGVWLWNFAGTNQKVWTSAAISADSNTATAESLWVAAATTSKATKVRYVTTKLFLGTRFNVNNNRSWTSRRGACTIWFDDNLRVAGKSDWGASRVEPPWRKWWRPAHFVSFHRRAIAPSRMKAVAIFAEAAGAPASPEAG